jgi:malate dehydrogenase
MSVDPPPIHVLITGAAGQIGYVLSGRVAHGDLFGAMPIVLHLFDLPEQMTKLSGLVMELEDCALPTLSAIVATDDPSLAFTDADYAIFLASSPIQPGQLRRDLLFSNAPIYKLHGEWLLRYAKPSIRVLVVANPVNTNCLVTQHYATNLIPSNITCMSLLDHNRSRSEIARLLEVPNAAVHKVISWGNHAESQVPDASHAEFDVGGGRRRVADAIPAAVRHGEFVSRVRDRGWAVLRARGQTSALSAASAAIQHMRSWIGGTGEDNFVSMGILVPEDSPYGIARGIVFSYPVMVDRKGAVEVVKGLEIDEWLREKLEVTEADLIEERNTAFTLLGIKA